MEPILINIQIKIEIFFRYLGISRPEQFAINLPDKRDEDETHHTTVIYDIALRVRALLRARVLAIMIL